MKNTSENPTNAHQRYENKRVAKPISFNKDKDAELISMVENMEFGVWVKHVLRSYTKLEANLLKNDINLLPAMLIEQALESGNFDLDEYLLAKGKKIVDVKEDPLAFIEYSDISGTELNSDEIYNQEFEYR